MADSNRLKMLAVQENSFAVTPSTPAMFEMRFTSESLSETPQTDTSKEIRSDRQVPDVARMDVSTSGDVAFELSPPVLGSTVTTPPNNMFDAMFPAALQASAWSAPATVTGTTISVDDGDSSFNHSGGGFSAIAVGQWFRSSNFANPANNGVWKVVAKPSNNKIIVTGKVELMTETSGSSRTLFFPPQIVNGVAFKSFSLEKRFTDLTNEFALLTGQAIGGMSLSIQRGSFVTGSFSFTGKREAGAGSTVAGSVIAATTTPIMTATDDLDCFMEGWDVSGGIRAASATGLTINLNNNLRGQADAGDYGPKSMGSGSVAVSGTFTTYFRDRSLMDKATSLAQTNLAAVLRRHAAGAANGWVIELPAVKFTSARRVGGGLNQDIMAELTYTAFRNASEDATIRIARLS